MLAGGRGPHAMLFTGPRGVGKFTLARMFAQAANCERLSDDFCGDCATCKRISLLADPQTLLEQGLIERGEAPTPPPSSPGLPSFNPILTSWPSFPILSPLK